MNDETLLTPEPAPLEDGRVPGLDGTVPLYDPVLTYRDGERTLRNAMMRDASATPEEADAVIKEHSRSLARVSFSSLDAATFYEALASTRSSPPDAAQRAAWASEARAAIAKEVGPERAAQALRDAQRLVAQTPSLRKTLDRTGLGSHPRVVVILAEKARLARNAGKLK